jgi:hypothetical protein
MRTSRSNIRRCANLAGAVIAGLLLSSCGGSTEFGTDPTTSLISSSSTSSTEPPTPGTALEPDATHTEDTMPSTSEPSVPDAVIASDLVQAAIADLVERTGAEPDEIGVVSVEEVDWPDGSIGCPQPGMVYTQAIVNGTEIVLRFDGTDYSYHQGGGRAVFYCPPDIAAATTTPPSGELDV